MASSSRLPPAPEEITGLPEYEQNVLIRPGPGSVMSRASDCVGYWPRVCGCPLRLRAGAYSCSLPALASFGKLIAPQPNIDPPGRLRLPVITLSALTIMLFSVPNRCVDEPV